MIPSATLAQPDRATATAILVAAIGAISIDSLCHPDRCGVVVVDTAIRGAPHSGGLAIDYCPVIDWAYARALRSLDVPGRRYVTGAYRLPAVYPDSVGMAVEFVPPALTMMDSGEVYVEITMRQYSIGLDAVVRVERRAGKWRAVGIKYREG